MIAGPSGRRRGQRSGAYGDISPGHLWSIFQLKSNFTGEVVFNQFHHDMQRKLSRLLEAA